MAITFRHDAAAVALPSSSASTRKYGQSLVMQQQQQKYAAQQAGYDRMFDAYKMESQNQFLDKRDTKQAINQQLRDWQQQDFQKQQMEAARQQQFMDDARKASSAMIMEDIQNGNYDPATARKLQQNLVAESEALGNPQLDATQRAEALQKIRAERALLSANRMEKPPAPTPQDQFDQQIVTRNGVDYVQNPKGGWEPLQQPKPSKEELQQQQQAEQMRPKTMQEYYGQDEGKFQKDLDSTLDKMQKDYDLDPEKNPAPTREDALDKMQKDYDFRQKALGRPQYGEPTLAPAQPGAAPAQPGEMKSILEQPDAPQPDMSQMENPLPSEYAPPVVPAGTAASAAYQSIMEGRGYRLITPTDGTRPYYYKGEGDPTKPPTPANEYDAAVAANGTGRMPYDVPQRQGQPAPAQNAWEDVASAGQPVPKQLDPMPPRLSKKSPAASAAPAVPDFGALTSSATSDRDKMFYNKVQQVYQGQTPEVQSAIGVILDPNSQDQDFLQAQMYLQQNGIDINQLMAGTPPKQARSAPSRTQPSRPVSPRSAGSKGYYKK